MDEKRDDIVEITDENGEKFEVEIIDIITMDDIEYAILAPLSQNSENNDEDEEEMILMRVKKEGEEYLFETIDDDDEFEKVAAYIDELADEVDD